MGLTRNTARSFAMSLALGYMKNVFFSFILSFFFQSNVTPVLYSQTDNSFSN